MATQFFPELNASTQDNHIRGTEQDDNFIVVGDVRAFEWYANNIDTGDGKDTVIIGGSMISEAINGGLGFNAINAEGALLVNITQDMVALGGSNRIENLSFSPDRDSVVGIGGTMRASASGENHIILQDGHNILNIGAMDATSSGRNHINSGHGELFELTVNGNVTSSDGGHNALTPFLGDQHIIIKGDVLAVSGGHNQITPWTTENDSHIEIHGDVIANNAKNTLINKSALGNASLTIGGKFQSVTGAESQIDIEGAQHNTLSIAQGIYVDQVKTSVKVNNNTYDGFNEVFLGGITNTNDSSLDIWINSAANIVTIDGNFSSDSSEALFEVNGVENVITVDGDFISSNSETQFLVNGEENFVTITGSIKAENSRSELQINGPHESHLIIGNGVWTSGGEQRITVYGTDKSTLDIQGGLHAQDNGINIVEVPSSGDQGASLSIKGNIFADSDSSNQILTNGFISLDGAVSTGSLQIHAGKYGYDVLELNALTYNQLGSHYRDWLSDLQANDAINDMNLEVIRIDTGRMTQTGLNSLGWLDDIVTAHNATYEEQLALELSVDRWGSQLSLNDFFSNTTSDKFSGLDMSGGASNSLTLSGSLADNGMDGDFLRIFGDIQDSVVLSDDWTLSQSGFVDVTGLSYDVYHNATDELLIQSTVSVV